MEHPWTPGTKKVDLTTSNSWLGLWKKYGFVKIPQAEIYMELQGSGSLYQGNKIIHINFNLYAGDHIGAKNTQQKTFTYFFIFNSMLLMLVYGCYKPKQLLSLKYLAKYGPLGRCQHQQSNHTVRWQNSGYSKGFEMGNAEITYWIDKAYWGRSVASGFTTVFYNWENATHPWESRSSWQYWIKKKFWKMWFFKLQGEGRIGNDCRGKEIDEVYYCLE